MRVLHVALFHDPHDVRIFEKEARELAAAGYEVHLLAPGAPGAADATCDGVRFQALGRRTTPGGISHRLWLAVSRAWQALRQALALRPDVVHLHEVPLIPVGLVLKLVGIRIVYDIHEEAFCEKAANARLLGYPKLGWLFGAAAALLEALAKLCFDRFVAATPYIGRNFPRRRTVVVQNFPRLRDVGNTTASESNRNDDVHENVVVYVGNVFARRGAVEMVQAVGHLPSSLQARLVIAGRFVPASLESQLQSLDGWSRVETTGWLDREQLRDVWRRARVALVMFHPLPEHQRAYPNKLFEAMAAGVPLVASDFPLWRRIVEDAECGLLVDPMQPVAIAKAIEFLLANPVEAERMGQAGRAAVRDTYHWEREATKLLDMYRGMSPCSRPGVR
jgi:glycosyltransferase involved in cell wall biosynthesis